MDIKAAHIDINARTKTERGNVPVFSECELRISIGHFGFADIAIWQKAGKGPQQGDFGLIATLTIYNPADMVRLANGLLALANAAEVIERSNAELRGRAAGEGPVERSGTNLSAGLGGATKKGEGNGNRPERG